MRTIKSSLLALFAVIFSMLTACLAACSSGESVTEADMGPGQDAAYFEPKPDAAQDQIAETDGNQEAALQADAAAEAAPPAPDAQLEPEAKPADAAFSAECQQYGTSQKITVFMRAPAGPDKVKVMAGWLNFPDYDADDTQWGTWCWGNPGENEMYCIPPDANSQPAQNYVGTYVEFAPAAADAKGDDPTKWGYYCTNNPQNPCPEGTFIVCSGTDEACRVENGKRTGTAEFKDWDGDGYPNIRCQL